MSRTLHSRVKIFAPVQTSWPMSSSYGPANMASKEETRHGSAAAYDAIIHGSVSDDDQAGLWETKADPMREGSYPTMHTDFALAENARCPNPLFQEKGMVFQ